MLLPKSREYIAEHRKLHPEIFRALKKAAFKPGAFYRGLILPLCKSGEMIWGVIDMCDSCHACAVFYCEWGRMVW